MHNIVDYSLWLNQLGNTNNNYMLSKSYYQNKNMLSKDCYSLWFLKISINNGFKNKTGSCLLKISNVISV